MARITQNDTRLLDNLDPPTVDYIHEYPSPPRWAILTYADLFDCYTSVPSRPSDPMLATTNSMSQLSPGKITFNSSFPFTVNGDESAETNRRPHRRSLDLTCGSATHIRSNTDVAKIVTWQPVSIMNSTSISFAQPVRNHGAAEPTTPTTMASPSSGGPRSTSFRGFWGVLSSP